MIIGVDVDLTVVDTLQPWVDWYRFHTGHDLNHIFEEQLDHGFNVQSLMTSHSTPLDFWRQRDLYDHLQPKDGCVEAINRLREIGHEIVFISYCFSEHIDSKVSFLRRNFGPEIKFIDTKHKEYVRMDVMIDDHSQFLENIKKAQPNCIAVQMMTPVNSLSPISDYHFQCWKELLRDPSKKFY